MESAVCRHLLLHGCSFHHVLHLGFHLLLQEVTSDLSPSVLYMQAGHLLCIK